MPSINISPARIRQEAIKTLRNLVVFYLVLVATIYGLQRYLQYFPNTTRVSLERTGLKGFEEHILPSGDDAKVIIWYAPPKPHHKVVAYFHGNGGNIEGRRNRYRALAEAGYGVLALSYRGYGGSTGSPSEEGLYQDARAALNFLPKDTEWIFLGESLGTGVATQMATEFIPKLLVLEAPFTSIPDIASIQYPYLPARWMVWDKFDSLRRIKQNHAPLLLLHGTADRVVPVSFGKTLFEAANETKKAIYFEGLGHVALSPEVLVQSISAFEQEMNKK